MRKYATLFQVSFAQTLWNYKALIGLSIFLMACLLIFANLWKFVAAKVGGVHLAADRLLWYIALNEWVLVSVPDIQEEMEEDLHTGRLAYLLPRPISYLGTKFCQAMGELSANLVILGIVTCLFTWLQVGNLPFGFWGMLISCFFAFCAGAVAILFQMSIGLMAFWFHDVAPFYWVWEKFLFMLGGLMLPLTIYPQWLQTVAYMTPFAALLSERSALAFDCSADRVLHLALSFIGWGFAGWVLVVVLYRKGLRVVNIGGG